MVPARAICRSLHGPGQNGADLGTCHLVPSGLLIAAVETPQLPREHPYLPVHDTEALSPVVERLRQGEEVLALFKAAADGRSAAAHAAWLSARLTIGELQRLLLPGCDERCQSRFHEPDAFVVIADLAVDPAPARPGPWWEDWNAAMQSRHQSRPIWFAGAPAMGATPDAQRLPAGSELIRIASTDPYWVHYDHVSRETLFQVASGPLEGERIVAVTFGHSALLPGFAGALIVPDHPPAHDPAVADHLLVAGWAAVRRGLPHEA
jgi:hypothetical protein